MEAPDKIYVPQYIIEATSVQKLDKPIVAGSTEYIRKDALLEWLRKKYKTISSYWYGDDFRLGKEDAYNEVIKKIESL